MTASLDLSYGIHAILEEDNAFGRRQVSPGACEAIERMIRERDVRTAPTPQPDPEREARIERILVAVERTPGISLGQTDAAIFVADVRAILAHRRPAPAADGGGWARWPIAWSNICDLWGGQTMI